MRGADERRLLHPALPALGSVQAPGRPRSLGCRGRRAAAAALPPQRAAAPRLRLRAHHAAVRQTLHAHREFLEKRIVSNLCDCKNLLSKRPRSSRKQTTHVTKYSE